jgi:predicted GNAT family acetyltransferase
MSQIQDNPAASRFELLEDGVIAFVAYRKDGNRIVLTHTEVPDVMAGRGVGSKLVHGVLDQLRSCGAVVVPQCEFVAAYIERHPEFRDLQAGAG